MASSAWLESQGATPSAVPLAPRPLHTRRGTSALEVAILFDDLPLHGPRVQGIDGETVVQSVLETLARHGVPPVVGLVRGRVTDENPASEKILWRWLASGNLLGNDGYSHDTASRRTVADYIVDLEKGEDELEKLEPDPRKWKVSLDPDLVDDGLDQGRSLRRYFEQHYYTVVRATLDVDDAAYDLPFARCVAKNDSSSLDVLHHLFVRGYVDELRRVRDLTLSLEHRDIPHVVALHMGAADADALDSLLGAFEQEGARWIDLRTAAADPFYAANPATHPRQRRALPYDVAEARGMVVMPSTFTPGLAERLDAMCR